MRLIPCSLPARDRENVCRRLGQALRALCLTSVELMRALRSVPRVEANRRHKNLHDAVAAARAASEGRMPLPPERRAALRRAINIVDAWFPRGANCVRRSLLEMALDPGAAHEEFLAGFQSRGGPGSGHAWLGSNAASKSFDAVFRL